MPLILTLDARKAACRGGDEAQSRFLKVRIIFMLLLKVHSHWTARRGRRKRMKPIRARAWQARVRTNVETVFFNNALSSRQRFQRSLSKTFKISNSSLFALLAPIKIICATYSSNQMENQNKIRLFHCFSFTLLRQLSLLCFYFSLRAVRMAN